MNDGQPHTILVQRTQASLEILLDNTFLNQIVIPSIPGNDDTILLMISPDHIYLGAQVDVTTGEVREGFKGCVTGVTLDRRELPLDDSGSADFSVLKFSSGNIISGCPLGMVVEVNQPNLHVYAGMGAIIAAVLIISVVFVTICAVGGAWRRARHGQHQLRSGGGSPSHGGFTWQAAYSGGGSGSTKSPPPSGGEVFHLVPPKPGSRAAHQPEGRVAETSLVTREVTPNSIHQTPSHSRQGSAIAPPEGFSLISQPNPGFLQESPDISELEDDRPNAAGRRGTDSRQRSIDTTRSDAAPPSTRSDPPYIPRELLGKDDTEVRKYLHKKVEVADAEYEQQDVDKIQPFNEEGPFEPLGSIGSLYDFVKDAMVNSASSAPHSKPQTSASPIKSTAPPTSTSPAKAPTQSSPGKRPRVLVDTTKSQPLISPKANIEGNPSKDERRPPHRHPPHPAHSPLEPHPSDGAEPHPLHRANSPPTATSLKEPHPPHREKPHSPPPKEAHPPYLSASPQKLNPGHNGAWEPVHRHSRSASQPEQLSVQTDPNVGEKNPMRLHRSGRRSHRVAAPVGNILDKFHQVTTGGGNKVTNGVKQDEIIL